MQLRALLTRQWRTVALAVVLMAATAVVASASDRGHEPLWSAQPGAVAATALSPDGAITLAILAHDDNHTVAAYGDGGAELWRQPLPGEATDWAVARDWVAAATPYPNASVTAYALHDGTPLFTLRPGVTPRAVAASGDRLAVALQAEGNPVTVYERWEPNATLTFSTFVLDLDLQGDAVAVGTKGGELAVARGAAEALRVPVGMRVLDVDLSADGTRLLAGGVVEDAPAGAGGLVQFYDLEGAAPHLPQWTHGDGAGVVGAVALSRAGHRAVALEEVPGDYRVLAFDAETGGFLDSAPVGGVATRDRVMRGIALSPDGSAVAVASLDGDLRLLDGVTLEERWSFRAAGATSVAFAGEDSAALAANARLLPGRPFDTLARWDAEREPLVRDLSRGLPLALGAEALAGAVALAWLERRDRR